MRSIYPVAFALVVFGCGACGNYARPGNPGQSASVGDSEAGTVIRAQKPSTVRLEITARSDSFEAASREYKEIWKAEGARIVAAMESISGIRFDAPPLPDTLISVVVFEGISYSGSRRFPAERPMLMRASYPADTKRATLVHELGHRLQMGVAGDEDEHVVLSLWIYDVWVHLWGKEFADAQVLVERRRRGPYPRAWDVAMSLSASERAARFRALRDRVHAPR